MKQIELEWTPGDNIRVFFTKIQKLKDELEDEYGIEWTDDLRITHVVSELADSNIFTEEEMMDWEELPKEDQTYVRMLTDFTKLFDKHARYGNRLAPSAHGFESANQLTLSEGNKEEVLQLLMQLLANQKEVAEAATADKEHLQQMTTSNEDLIAIIKKQSTQIEKLIEQKAELTNQVKNLTEALTKTKTISSSKGGGGGGGGGGTGGGGGGNNNTSSGSKPKCAICGLRHNTKDCWELEANADKRPDGWKSRLE